MDWNWRLKAACLDVPVDQATHGDTDADGLKKFIASYCDRCEVWQKCWDSRLIEIDGRTYDDNEFTVRGGKLPLRSTGVVKGRPKGSSTGFNINKLKAEDPDRYLNALIRWTTRHPNGECERGHVITDEFSQLRIRFRGEDVSAGCRQCERTPGQPKEKATHCKNGHEFTPQNTSLTIRTDNGVTREYRRCRVCLSDAAEAQKGNTRGRTTHCNKGHLKEGDNVIIVKKDGKDNRLCKTCYRTNQNRRNKQLAERRKAARQSHKGDMMTV